MKKFFFLMLAVVCSLGMHATIEVTIQNRSSYFGLLNPAADGSFKYEYDATNKDSIEIAYKNIRTTSNATDESKRYPYIMFDKQGPCMYANETIEGYYVRKVILRKSTSCSQNADLAVEVTFSKTKTDTATITSAATKIAGNNRLFEFGNADKENIYWNISANTVANTQLDSIVIIYCKNDGSEDEVVPIPDPAPVAKRDTISVKQALDSIKIHKNDEGWKLPANTVVEGVVVSWPSLGSGKASCYIADREVSDSIIQAYNIVKADGKTFETFDEAVDTFKLGYTVYILANNVKYYEHSTDPSKNKNEIDGGNFIGRKDEAPENVMMLSDLDTARATIDEVENEFSITFSAMSGTLEMTMPIDVEKDLSNEKRAIAHKYTKQGVDFTFTEGGQTATMEIVYADILLSYQSCDAAGVNTYAVRASIYANNTIWGFIDTLVIAGVDGDNKPFYFTMDNGSAVRKLSVARAVQEALALAQGTPATELVWVYGYWTKDDKAFAGGQQSFYMSDTQGDAASNFKAYATYTDSAIEAGDFVLLKGKLQNYNGEGEISGGTAIIIDPADCPELLQPEDGPEVPLDTISADRAYQIGMALNNTTEKTELSTSKEYVIIGVCTGVSSNYGWDAEKGTEGWYMANDTGAYGNFQCYNCKPDYEVVKGDTMMVVGKIYNYCGSGSNGVYNNIEVKNVTAVHVSHAIPNDKDEPLPPDDPSALQTVEQASKKGVVKVIENGQVIFIRDGVKYNVFGMPIE